LKLGEELGDKNRIAIQLGNIGVVYDNQGDYPKALKYYFKALKMRKELGTKNLIASTLSNIGGVYREQSDYPKALEYYFKTLKMDEELGDKTGIAIDFHNIGSVYYSKGDYPRALEYYFKSLKIKEELGNIRGIAITIGNIGIVYKEQGNYPKALEYYFKALKMDEELGNKNGIARHLGNIGALYTEQKKYPEAERYLLQALEIDTAIGTLVGIKYRYEALSELYEQTRQYQKAYEHYKEYSIAKDTLYNEEKSKEIGKLEASHEYETQMLEQQKEHEKQQALAAAELKRQRIIGYSFIGGFVLVLILAFVIYRSFRQKKKANRLLEEKNTIIEEKNKDITDSIRYAQNIQSAILPHEAEIKKALPDHFIYFQPRDIVSGDFYWFTAHPRPLPKGGESQRPESSQNSSAQRNGKCFIACCDCTGHGVPGAFVSMIGNDLLNQIIIEKGIEDPGEILTNINNGVKSVFTREGAEQQAQDGMDMTLCVFDKDLRTLEFAGANNPLLLMQNGELNHIKGDKYAIGGDTEIDYKFANHKIDLQKGNTIYIFSDGYQDQFGGPKGKKFMSKRFRQLFIDIQTMNMEEQKEHLNKTIEDWKKGRDQVDDILVIGIRV